MNPVDEVMLDEYGNPVGQLNVRLGSTSGIPTAVVVSDTAVERAQDDAQADAADNLPGIDPKEVAEYYPGYDDPDKREKAKRLMLAQGKQVAEIASAILVPERTVYMWISTFHWAEVRRLDLMAREEVSRLELAETRINRRNEVFREQLDEAKKLRRKAIDAIETKEASVKSGTEAWAAASKTEQTILGLSDAGNVAAADGKEKASGGKGGDEDRKAPLVMVINGGGLPPMRMAGQ